MRDSPQMFVLAHPRARELAQRAVLGAPDGFEIIVRPPTRNAQQNAYLHALLTDLTKAMPVWGGERMRVDDWKAAMVHALDTHEGQPGKAVPGLEGGIFLLRRQTRTMSKKDLSALIEYAQMWMAKHNIPVRTRE